MKRILYKKSRRLISALFLCIILYLLACTIIPPLIGTRTKSRELLSLPVPVAARIGLIDTNEAALEWRLRLINSAQEEIILSTFDFRADSSGTDILAALLHAAQRGVQIRLIVDGINAQLHLTGRSVFQALAAHENVEVKLYNPIRLFKLWTINYRCHDKYLIVDRASYIMGGRNTSDLFLGSGGTSRRNTDHEVVVHDAVGIEELRADTACTVSAADKAALSGATFGSGAVFDSDAAFSFDSGKTSVAPLLNYFNDIWSQSDNQAFFADAEKESVKAAVAELAARWSEISSERPLAPIDWERETVQADGITILSGDCSARNKRPLLLNTLTELMRQAEESVILQTPYMICNRTMYDALQSVAAGPAQVQVITNAPQNGANPWGCADYLHHRRNILATGVSVCEWIGDASMHTKTILIDHRISLIGSFNWDMRSAYLDTELMLLADCPALNDLLRKEASQMLQQGRLVAPDGTATEGSDYVLPESSPVHDFLQRILSILIQPFRYVL